MWRLVVGAFVLATGCPSAAADVGPGNIAGEPGIGGGPNLSPVAASALFLCPGVGTAVNVLGGGGGFCDFNFTQVQLDGRIGVMHDHCEFMGFAPVAAMWRCWRVFPGQPDHPPLPDPDIIPDGWGVPWAIRGPTPLDQWPPEGLVPGDHLIPPPEPPP